MDNWYVVLYDLAECVQVSPYFMPGSINRAKNKRLDTKKSPAIVFAIWTINIFKALDVEILSSYEWRAKPSDTNCREDDQHFVEIFEKHEQNS